MKRSAVLVPIIIAILGGAGWGLMAASSKSGRWSRFPNQFEVRARKEREMAERKESAAGVEPEKRASQNLAIATTSENATSKALTFVKAVPVERVYNFGAMNPFRRKRHTFKIRNEGTDTLTLRSGETSCKCTACEVLTPEVAPGAEGLIEVEWKSVGRQESYRHSARVYTNDPDQEFIRLVVEGSVRTHLGAEPPDLNLPRVNPLEQTSARTTLYSQAWKSFTVTDFESSLPGLTWEVASASDEELKPFEGVSGYNLKVTLPADLPSGEFRHTLRFMVRQDKTISGKNAAEDDAADENASIEPIQYEIAIEGKVLRRLSIHGEAIDGFGVIHLDPVNPRTGAKKRFLMKINDSQLDLPVKSITCQPEYVKATVTPYLPEGKQVGLYYLDIKIPSGIPPGVFQNDRMGKIQFDFDHPRVEDLDLQLEFVVSPPE